jgi:hypothetical protein
MPQDFLFTGELLVIFRVVKISLCCSRSRRLPLASHGEANLKIQPEKDTNVLPGILMQWVPGICILNKHPGEFHANSHKV